MKLPFRISLLILGGLGLFGCTSASSVSKPGYDFGKLKKVAVIEVNVEGRSQAAANEVNDLFSMELLKRGYDVIERSQVEAVLEEQKFQASEMTEEKAVASGRILNVDAVVMANVSEMGQHVSMTAKMIDTESAVLLWTGEGSGRVGGWVAPLLGGVAGAAAGAAVGHQFDSNEGALVGGAIGGVLGGVAGYALSPTEAKTVRKVIRKVSKGMPGRV